MSIIGLGGNDVLKGDYRNIHSLNYARLKMIGTTISSLTYNVGDMPHKKWWYMITFLSGNGNNNKKHAIVQVLDTWNLHFTKNTKIQYKNKILEKSFKQLQNIVSKQKSLVIWIYVK